MTRALAKRPARTDLAKYNPEKGLKTIAVAEAAEKYYRARDREKFYAAVEAKLVEQLRFIEWWDTYVEKQQGRPKKRNGSDTVIAGKDGLPDRVTLQRWRPLKIPAQFQAKKLRAQERCAKIAEFTQSTGSTAGVNMPESNEWYTPARYVEAARAVLGAIDLDPASSDVANATVKAAQFFTRDDDGLTQPWHGRVWMNPPYSGQAAAFIERLTQTLRAGDVVAAVVLVNSHGTDTQWFQPLWDGLVCFTDHRINFISPQGAEESGSNHGSVFAYFGPDRNLFLQVFTPFGPVVERARL